LESQNSQLQEENLRMKTTLEIARRLQRMLLPNEQELAQVTALDIVTFLESADEVGGDYYDVAIHEGQVKISIGDVTGHGLDSGILAIMVQTAVRTLLNHGEMDPVRFINALNRTIYGNVKRMNVDKSLTFSVASYRDGQLILSGQHEEVIVVHHGQIESINTMDLGFPIGLEEDISTFITETCIRLVTGDY
jgi:sigma-B regulation protein RsbU (phosphoserine phosphatase)